MTGPVLTRPGGTVRPVSTRPNLIRFVLAALLCFATETILLYQLAPLSGRLVPMWGFLAYFCGGFSWILPLWGLRSPVLLSPSATLDSLLAAVIGGVGLAGITNILNTIGLTIGYSLSHSLIVGVICGALVSFSSIGLFLAWGSRSLRWPTGWKIRPGLLLAALAAMFICLGGLAIILYHPLGLGTSLNSEAGPATTGQATATGAPHPSGGSPGPTAHRGTATGPAATKPRRPAAPRSRTPNPPKPAPGSNVSFYRGHGGCAALDFPRGSVIKVTNLANGKSIRCKVTMHGPAYHDKRGAQPRRVNLAKADFAHLAPTATGLLTASVVLAA